MFWVLNDVLPTETIEDAESAENADSDIEQFQSITPPRRSERNRVSTENTVYKDYRVSQKNYTLFDFM